MEEVERLKQMAIRAHKAGDTDSAQAIYSKIKQLEVEEPASAYGEYDPMEGMSGTDKFIVGVGRGMTNVGRGAQDLYYRATDDDDALERLNGRIEADEKAWKHLSDNSFAASAGEVTGELVSTLPMAGGVGVGLKAAGATASKLGMSAGRLSKLSRAAPIATASIDGALTAGLVKRGGVEERLDAAGTGALIGAGASAVLGTAAKVGRKYINGRSGNFTDERALNADQLSKEFDTRVHLDDAKDSQILQKVSSILEDLPVIGTGKGKALQNKEVKQATMKLLDDMSGGAPSDAITANLQRTFRETFDGVKSTKNKLYNEYFDEISKYGNLSRRETNTVLDDLIATEKAAGGLDDSYLTALKKMRSAPEGDAKVLKKMYDSVSDLSQKGFSGTGLGSSQSVSMQKLKEALNKDAENFGAEINKVMDADVLKLKKAADSFYKEKYVPFKESKTLNTALKNDEPEAIMRALTAMNGSGVRTNTVYSALNKEGKAALRTSFLLEAFTKANKDGVFSPKAFRTYVRNLDSTHKVLFPKGDKEKFNRLLELMDYAKNSAQHASNPVNGSRMVIASAMGGATVAALPLAAKVATMGAFFKAAVQTESGRRLFTATSRRTKDSQNMDLALDTLDVLTRKILTLDSVQN